MSVWSTRDKRNRTRDAVRQRQIDALVYAQYGMTEAEAALVEGAQTLTSLVRRSGSDG